MRLIPEAPKAYKLWSVQASTVSVLAACAELAVQVLPLWKAVVPSGIFLTITALAGTLSIVLRQLKQDLSHE